MKSRTTVRYTCEVCQRTFAINAEVKTLAMRCPLCGGKGVEMTGRVAPASVSESRIGRQAEVRWRCRACGEVFVPGSEELTPSCPKCRALGAIAMTPAVFAISKGRVPEGKKEKYRRRSWKLLGQLEESTNTVLAFAKMLGIDDNEVAEARQVLQRLNDIAREHREKVLREWRGPAA